MNAALNECPTIAILSRSPYPIVEMNEPLSSLRAEHKTQYQVCCPRLPLAVYREVAAHLRQVNGVNVELLPQTSQQFDYTQSQVGGLRIEYTSMADAGSRQRVSQILTYYGDRYGSWQEF